MAPLLVPSRKAFLSPSVWSRREYTWTLIWKGNLLIYLALLQAGNTLVFKPLNFPSTNWRKHPLVKRTAKYLFFIGVAIKLLFYWVGVQLQCPCANLMICSFRFKKDVLILKMSLCILCFWFFLKPYPIQVIISIPMWIKLTMCQLLLFFLCNFCSLFSYAGSVLVKAPFFHRYWFIYFDYSANYDTQRVFVINFLISNDLLNCFRSVATIVISTESG